MALMTEPLYLVFRGLVKGDFSEFPRHPAFGASSGAQLIGAVVLFAKGRQTYFLGAQKQGSDAGGGGSQRQMHSRRYHGVGLLCELCWQPVRLIDRTGQGQIQTGAGAGAILCKRAAPCSPYIRRPSCAYMPHGSIQDRSRQAGSGHLPCCPASSGQA